MRIPAEFHCSLSGGGCDGYFITYFRSNMYGNYTIECPNCQHHHFRVIEEGLITADRHNLKFGETTIMVGLKSTYRKTPWHEDPAFKRSQLYFYNGGSIPLCP